MRRLPVSITSLHDALAQTLGQQVGAREIGFGQQEDEFLAAVASRNVDIPQALFAAAGYRNQNMVSRDVAVGVVDAFEMVKVDQDNRQGGPVTPGALELAPGGFEEIAAVVQPGQGIGDRQALYLLKRRAFSRAIATSSEYAWARSASAWL